MMRATLGVAGLAVLAVAWLGPLPALARHAFSAHMTMHMAVVAVAAPLIALGVSTTWFDPTRTRPRLFTPIPASIVELGTVWAWHTPMLHHAARQATWPLVLEQASFLAAGLLLWVAAVGGDREQRRLRGGAGIAALLFTSMHMTLLGVLFALAPRALFEHAAPGVPATALLADQHLGGAIMLLVGGTSYLLGGLWLTAIVLRPPSERPDAILKIVERRVPNDVEGRVPREVEGRLS